jgi:YD repeat-containing protein
VRVFLPISNNNLTQKANRNSQTITYLYDARNRLTSKTYHDTAALDYTYDMVGKILQSGGRPFRF